MIERLAYIFVKVVQPLPRFLVRRLHECQRSFGGSVTDSLLDLRKKSLGLCDLCALLRLLLATSLDGLELGRGIDVVKLGPELDESVKAGKVKLAYQGLLAQ